MAKKLFSDNRAIKQCDDEKRLCLNGRIDLVGRGSCCDGTGHQLPFRLVGAPSMVEIVPHQWRIAKLV